MDMELKLMLGLTRRLPRVRGAGVLSNSLRKWYLRKQRGWVDADVYGFQMRLELFEQNDGQLLFHPQLYDWQELNFLRRHLGIGDVFIDIGASLGLYSLTAATRVGAGGRVLAIEADPYNYQKMWFNLRLNHAENVIPCNVGIADTTQKLRLMVRRDGWRGGNTFLPLSADTTNSSGITIQCQPLYTLIKQHALDAIRGLKIDIEGLEYRVLKQFFADTPPRLYPEFIIVEYIPERQEVAGGDVLALLKGMGYTGRRASKLNYIMVRQ